MVRAMAVDCRLAPMLRSLRAFGGPSQPVVTTHRKRRAADRVGPDGPLAQPLGKVGRELTLERGYAAARLTALSMLGTLKRALGDLDRIAQWVRIFGMVNSAPGFVQQPAVINGFSDLILELWGPEAGAHARSAVGMAELPFGMPVEIEGEVQIVTP